MKKSADGQKIIAHKVITAPLTFFKVIFLISYFNHTSRLF